VREIFYEPLEPRRLLSASFATISSAGTLAVTDTPGDDVMRVIYNNGGTKQKVLVIWNDQTVEFNPADIKRLYMQGTGGNDIVQASIDVPSTVLGGEGNDFVAATAKVKNVMRGGPGDDMMGGSPGADLMYGDEGNDSMNGDPGDDTLIGGPGADTMIGASGMDTVDYSDRKTNLNVTLDNKSNDGASGELDDVASSIDIILGGSGNDKLVGTPFKNILKGNAGNDTLWGGAGDDTLDGGSGHDLLFGQDGNDTLLAKDGSKDSLDGGNGFDSAKRDNSSTAKDSPLNIEKFI
jgi:Ca2+-binding RTX toxin-like protein